MNDIEILEGNKLIAEFMGGKTSDKSRFVSGYQNIWLPVHGVCRWDTIETGKGRILRYHSSLDWLMPVVEEINTLEHISGIDFQWQMLQNVFINFTIGDVYRQVVEFVKWYNENVK